MSPLPEANRVEVKKMLLTEYNETKTMELFKEEGRAQGRAEGRVEGRAEGRVEGIAEGRADTIRKMLESGIPASVIAEALDMTVEQCEALR
jgi:predicted transposase YdaD